MSAALELPERDDARVIWVFTADLDRPAFAQFAKVAKPWPLADALGLAGLNPRAVETFFAEDLNDYGLDRYLADAHGMDPRQVAPDAPRLAAVKGPVVLLFSRDLPPGASRIDPRPPLAFLGRYDAPYDLAPAMPHPSSSSTRGHIPGPGGPGTDPAILRRAVIYTLIALLALALLVMALV